MRNRSNKSLFFVVALVIGLIACGGSRGAQSSQTTARGTESLVESFQSTDATVADAAYFKLFSLGADGIPALIDLLESKHLYSGGAFQHSKSSIVTMQGLPVSLVAMYVIEAILLDNPTPHLFPHIVSNDASSSEVSLMKGAIERHREWWAKNKDLTLEDLQAGP